MKMTCNTIPAPALMKNCKCALQSMMKMTCSNTIPDIALTYTSLMREPSTPARPRLMTAMTYTSLMPSQTYLQSRVLAPTKLDSVPLHRHLSQGQLKFHSVSILVIH